MRLIKAVFLISIVSIAMISSSAPAEEFYKGKTLRFIVGQAPGGGYDTYVPPSRAISANTFQATPPPSLKTRKARAA